MQHSTMYQCFRSSIETIRCDMEFLNCSLDLAVKSVKHSSPKAQTLAEALNSNCTDYPHLCMEPQESDVVRISSDCCSYINKHFLMIVHSLVNDYVHAVSAEVARTKMAEGEKVQYPKTEKGENAIGRGRLQYLAEQTGYWERGGEYIIKEISKILELRNIIAHSDKKKETDYIQKYLQEGELPMGLHSKNGRLKCDAEFLLGVCRKLITSLEEIDALLVKRGLITSCA